MFDCTNPTINSNGTYIIEDKIILNFHTLTDLFVEYGHCLFYGQDVIPFTFNANTGIGTCISFDRTRDFD